MNPVWNPVSARFAHSIAKWAVNFGLIAADAEHVAAKIVADVRKDIRENAAKTAETEGKGGTLKTHEVKEHAVKQRVSGVKLLKLSIGEKEEWFIENCSGVTQALVRVDQCLAGLEKVGAGIDWTPPVGSVLERHLTTAATTVKATMDANRAKEAAAKEAAAKNG